MTRRLIQMTAVGVLASGCTHTLQIGSTPKDVLVYAIKPDGETTTLLGRTPVVLQSNTDEDFFYLKLEKIGYASRIVMLPFYRRANETEVFNVTLKAQNNEWFKNSLRSTYLEQTDALIRDFLSLQESIIQENDAECLRYIDILGKNFSKLATYQSLVGAYFWKKNRLHEARKAYLRLLQLDPSNTEALSMLKAIEAIL